MKHYAPRCTAFYGFALTLLLIANSYWLEFYKGIMPCALCSLQRLTFMMLCGLFAVGTLIAAKNRSLYRLIYAITCVFSSLGIWFAGRQVWLQWQPSANNGDCGVSLHYLLKMLPLNQALLKAIHGSADCSQVTWTLLHLSPAAWSLGFFTVIVGVSLYQFKKSFQK